MAFTITHDKINVVGNHVEEYATVVTDATSGNFETKIPWIEDVDVSQIAGTDRQIRTWPNSKTASAVEDDPGWVFVDNIASGTTYKFLIVGK